MKRLLTNIIVFTLIVIMPTVIIDKVVKDGMKKSDLLEGCVNDIFNGKASADILISGNSRASNHFSPRILDSVLHKSVYNIGVRAWGAQMFYCLFKLYMVHDKKPQYIIMNIGHNSLFPRDDFFGYEQFIPYANDSIVQHFTNKLQGAFTFADRHYPLFAFNNHPELIKEGIKSYFNIGKRATKIGDRGFVQRNEPWTGDLEAIKKENADVFKFIYNDSTVHLFDQFVKECRDSNIKVIFVCSPTYYEATALMTNRQEMLDIYNNISKKYDVPILDYTFDSMCYDKKNFMNTQHLNGAGAEVFSRKVAQDLKQYIH